METPQRKRVGVALGGGVVRGMAHLGVLAALEHGGIPVDVVAGTSVGSLIGAFYSTGKPPDELARLTNGLGWRHMIRPVWFGDGFVSFAGLEQWLVGQIGDLQFSDLARPFAVVASDIDNWRSVILREGRVAAAVRASCSVPGLIQPVEIRGRRLADGGITNSVPVDAARLLGAEYVIGVNIFGGLPRKRRGPLKIGIRGAGKHGPLVRRRVGDRRLRDLTRRRSLELSALRAPGGAYRPGEGCGRGRSAGNPGGAGPVVNSQAREDYGYPEPRRHGAAAPGCHGSAFTSRTCRVHPPRMAVV